MCSSAGKSPDLRKWRGEMERHTRICICPPAPGQLWFWDAAGEYEEYSMRSIPMMLGKLGILPVSTLWAAAALESYVDMAFVVIC